MTSSGPQRPVRLPVVLTIDEAKAVIDRPPRLPESCQPVRLKSFQMKVARMDNPSQGTTS
jgi:hypothetical protein